MDGTSLDIERLKAVTPLDIRRFRRKHRKPVIEGDVAYLPLSNGLFACVDTDILERPLLTESRDGRLFHGRLCDHTWTGRTWRHTSYAQLIYGRGKRDQHVAMHRLIAEAAAGQIVDHINHNGLDNRRANLRLVDSARNSQNSRKQRQTPHRFKCVYPSGPNWEARIKQCGVKRHLGTYATDIEAAKAYDIAALELFGEHACLNFPDLDYTTEPPPKRADLGVVLPRILAMLNGLDIFTVHDLAASDRSERTYGSRIRELCEQGVVHCLGIRKCDDGKYRKHYCVVDGQKSSHTAVLEALLSGPATSEQLVARLTRSLFTLAGPWSDKRTMPTGSGVRGGYWGNGAGECVSDLWEGD